jgi:hypothetical protein
MRNLKLLAHTILAASSVIVFVHCGSGDMGTEPDDAGNDSAAPKDAGKDSSPADAGPPDAGPTSFAVGGTVMGLLPSVGFSTDGGVGDGGGNGAFPLVLSNGTDRLPVLANGTFLFPTKLSTGASYAVKVENQPNSPAQTCVVTGGTGTISKGDVSSVAVNCTPEKFTVGGTVTGLVGSAVLQLNGAADLTISALGTYAVPAAISAGTAYTVTVKTQPGAPAQVCTVTRGTGTVLTGNVTNVDIACVTQAFKIKGTIDGLDGAGLTLKNGAETLPVAANSAAFEFVTPVDSGANYAVTIGSQPAGNFCVISNGSGAVGAADVANVKVSCTPVGSTTFAFTGAAQTFVVPARVTHVRFEILGAAGGVGNGAAGGAGGLGASATGELDVVAGAQLGIFVGGAGGALGVAGFNGGGAGGSANGGGGGGASDVRVGGVALANRVIVAGGGGGGGATGCFAVHAGGVGGGGGGVAGGNGVDSPSGGGGAGGLLNVGGAAGIGCGGFLGGAGNANGTGGVGQTCCCPTTPSGGGGGGGFLVGGGGGGGSAGTVGCSGNDKGGGGGGAGGSNFIGGVTNGAVLNSVRAGSGQIKITWP